MSVENSFCIKIIFVIMSLLMQTCRKYEICFFAGCRW